MIIGICGAAGAGKDTIAARLAESHGYRRVAFADPLYEMVAVLTGMPDERLRDRAIKDRQIEWLGQSPRHLLQTLGTEWGRRHVSDDVWIRLAMRKANEHANAVVPDVRFDNEAEAIKAAGGVIWSVVRRGFSCLNDASSGHASERGISPELIDEAIPNDGSLESLKGRVDAALQKATARYNGGMHASCGH